MARMIPIPADDWRRLEGAVAAQPWLGSTEAIAADLGRRIIPAFLRRVARAPRPPQRPIIVQHPAAADSISASTSRRAPKG